MAATKSPAAATTPATAGRTPPPAPAVTPHGDVARGEGTTYTVALPVGLPLLNANRSRRQHWSAVRRTARDIRQAAFLAARSQHIPLLDRAHVVYVIHPTPQTRRRDPSNWAETGKAAVDGLVDAGVFPDDDSEHVIGPDPRLGEPVKGGQFVLHITPAGGTTP
jgi:crossover junction endodeoxyribonuclease RusA